MIFELVYNSFEVLLQSRSNFDVVLSVSFKKGWNRGITDVLYSCYTTWGRRGARKDLSLTLMI